MTEKGMYFASPDFYNLIKQIGGTWNDKKERPVVCLIKSTEHVASALKFGICCYIFDFKDTVTLVSYNTFALDAVIIKHIHRTLIDIAVDHILLFVSKQQQRKKLLFVFFDFNYFHLCKWGFNLFAYFVLHIQ